MRNHTLIFKKVPNGAPVAGQDLVVEDRPIDLSTPPPGGQIVEVLTVSFDPYMRGKMRAPSVTSYSSPFALDGPVVADTISRMIRSDSPALQEGDLVLAILTVAE